SMTSGSRSVLSCSSSFIVRFPLPKVAFASESRFHATWRNPRCPRQLHHRLWYVHRSLKKGRVREGRIVASTRAWMGRHRASFLARPARRRLLLLASPLQREGGREPP